MSRQVLCSLSPSSLSAMIISATLAKTCKIKDLAGQIWTLVYLEVLPAKE